MLAACPRAANCSLWLAAKGEQLLASQGALWYKARRRFSVGTFTGKRINLTMCK